MAYTSLFKKDDVRITQAFSSTHKGLDLSRGVVEQPIYLPNKAVSGTVWKILPSYSTGGVNYPNAPIIYVRHKDGSGSRYIHSYPKNVKVKVGDTVVAGQQICCTGNSGHSFGDHLHFEWLTKWDDLNSRVNPAPFVINDAVSVPEPISCEEYQKEIDRLEEVNRGLTEALATSQEGINKLSEELKLIKERVEFLESTLAVRETELSDLELEKNRILEERNRFEAQYIDVVTELNELKANKDMWFSRLVSFLDKLFHKKE
jgi:FtsZ-binding cell division protein ZapB